TVVEELDTLRPRARALDGRGDSVAAPIYWASLDTANLLVVDSTTGVTVARQPGTGRLQARVVNLRSNPRPILVLAAADTLFAPGEPEQRRNGRAESAVACATAAGRRGGHRERAARRRHHGARLSRHLRREVPAMSAGTLTRLFFDAVARQAGGGASQPAFRYK